LLDGDNTFLIGFSLFHSCSPGELYNLIIVFRIADEEVDFKKVEGVTQ